MTPLRQACSPSAGRAGPAAGVLLCRVLLPALLPVLLLALLLGGCAHTAPPAAAADAAPASPRYEIELSVEGGDDPAGLRALLLTHLDLARFRAASDDARANAGDGSTGSRLSATELRRLVAAAPAQAQALLETQGYFDAALQTELLAPPGADTLQVRLRLQPGPRSRIGAVEWQLPPEWAAGPDLADSLAANWLLPRGEAFSQAGWSGAKAASLAQLRAAGFARARWADTLADVDADAHTATLRLMPDSGPRFLLGELRIVGLQQHGEQTVQGLAGFGRGQTYSEQLLFDFQERLVKSQLFDSARVELLEDAAQPAGAAADVTAQLTTQVTAPVQVTVREAPLQQASASVGFRSNTGQRLGAEYQHRRPLGLPLRARFKFEYGRELRSVELELSSHPLSDLRRNLASLQIEQDRSGAEILTNVSARVGRLREGVRYERLLYAEYLRGRETQGPVSTTSQALSANAQWIGRWLDSTLLPTDGFQALALVGAGFATSDRDRDGPFGRLQLKLGGYKPLGQHWFGNARLELGQVLAAANVGVPEKLLWRAGGDDSVRGYGFNDLGPLQNGVVVGGRVLATASIELARPFTLDLPSLWGAVFVDAGNAARSWGTYRPALGWGVGVRWRSPVGPLRIDVARGEQTGRWRLHFSVGIAL